MFYDGECGLCNRSVQFILRHEKNCDIHFATLQAEFARTFFEKHQLPTPDMQTFYYIENDTLYEKSDAAFKVAGNLKFPFSFIRVFRLFPQWLCDKVYDVVAKNRKKIGGIFCAVPTQEQKKRFL